MTDRDFTQQSEHEERVAQVEERGTEPAHTGPPGSADRVVGDPGAPSYAEEVEAEHRGETAEDLQPADDSDAPLDSAYKPRTG
ncbi:MAG TPA: hypothetical protein VHK63_00220 [Candidatus Limnocylindria bacterium]|nr:hypothetical protein [Candidatus Limnocylindria bacterium]